MKHDGLDNVTTQPVQVPHWICGEESLSLLAPHQKALQVLGLGGTVATAPTGLEGDCVVVTSFDDLKRRGSEIPGKIVVYNVPFTRYGKTVQYRIHGATEAARFGAKGALLSSVTPNSLGTPHTGVMYYDPEVEKIPFAAITKEDALMLGRIAARGQRPRVRLRLSARFGPEAVSHNVMAELLGRELPHQVVVIGGHIDSWDVGQGAQDDAAGCLVAWEAVRLLKELGLRPRRTIRVVFWTNEENGTRGAEAYRDWVAPEIQNHVLAIESDYGIFKPTGFSYSGNRAARKVLKEALELLAPLEATEMTEPGGGVDIRPLMELGVPGLGLNVVPTRYFWYHHSPADTVDKVDDASVCSRHGPDGLRGR